MNNQVIQTLRDQVRDLTNERNVFRRELRQEIARNRILTRNTNNLRREVNQLQTENDDLQTERDNLNQNIAALNRNINRQKPRNHNKLWGTVGNQTKRKRKADYHALFDETLQKIPECKKAKIELRLGSEDVNFKWSLFQMQQHRDRLRNQGLVIRDPIIQPLDETDNSDNEQENDARNKRKRRGVVSLMDKFQLSQRGYHEIRYLLTKSAPPINQIRQERVIMSCEIPYIKHPDVSLCKHSFNVF